ncbi:MAG: YitT family protein [Oscillospiraceae bacterium]
MKTWKTIKWKEIFTLTWSTLLMAVDIYFFKFPNNFSFGGVTGLAVVLARVMPFLASDISFVLNMLLLVLGFAVLGRSFGIKTVYTSVLLSVAMSVLERICPLQGPLTNQPLLELLFAIALPALASAVLFYNSASSGGADIIALVMKKYSQINIGKALLISDAVVAVASFFLFGVQTGLMSTVGVVVKSVLVDGFIQNMNTNRYITVICEDKEKICDYIVKVLHRSATMCTARGVFSNRDKYMIITAMRSREAVKLRKFIRESDPHAFVLVQNTYEIMGKGFKDYF